MGTRFEFIRPEAIQSRENFLGSVNDKIEKEKDEELPSLPQLEPDPEPQKLDSSEKEMIMLYNVIHISCSRVLGEDEATFEYDILGCYDEKKRAQEILQECITEQKEDVQDELEMLEVETKGRWVQNENGATYLYPLEYNHLGG